MSAHTQANLQTIFIVDDDKNSRESLRRFFNSIGYMTESFSSGASFLERLPYDGVGCLILDYEMPRMNGIELQQVLNDRGDSLPIVFLSARGDIPTSVKAMRQGAVDFVCKMADENELLHATEGALRRSAETMNAYHQDKIALAAAATLTDRELLVCKCVISGMLNKQIAIKLDIAERTVKAHRAKVMQKFGVESVPDLVRIAEKGNVQVIQD